MNGKYDIDAGFFDGERSRLFAVTHRPRNASRGIVAVCIPPFGEEKNKTRRQIAVQCREFAKNGFSAMAFDLEATGDSEGTAEAVRWNVWVKDCVKACEYAGRAYDSDVIVWGVRAGALLVAEALAEIGLRVVGVVLWQPVDTGKRVVREFLRTAAMEGLGEEDKVLSTSQQRAVIEREKASEVAGYTVTDALIKAIEEASLSAISFPPNLWINWLEIRRAGSPNMIRIPALCEKWRNTGLDVKYEVLTGERFWSSVEIEEEPQLVAATTEAVLSRFPK